MSTAWLSIERLWRRRRLPVQLQSEKADCGMACLAMIASFHGHHTDVAALHRRFAASSRGMTLKSLMSMAAALELQSRPVKLALELLPQLRRPCILHWDLNHFVVLKALRRRGAVIHDPANGQRYVRRAELSRHFTGVALELAPGPDFVRQSLPPSPTLRSLMGRVTGLSPSLLRLLLLGLALQACVLLAPFYLQWVVDEALITADRDLLLVLSVGCMLLVLLQSAIGAVRSWSITTLATQLNCQWLDNVFAHLLRLPVEYFERRHLGDIVSRFGSVQTIQRGLTTQLVEALIDGLLVIATLIMMLLYSPLLTLVASATVLIYALCRRLWLPAQRAAGTEQVTHLARAHTQMLESVRAVQSMRVFGRCDERRASWLSALMAQLNAELRLARLSINAQLLNQLLSGLERIIVIWLAAQAVLDTRMTVGMLFAFLSYQDQFTQRGAALIDKFCELRLLRLHGERVADIVRTEPEPAGLCTTAMPVGERPGVEFRDVSFRYGEAEPPVLQQLSLQIHGGECLAICGASGCGKSTLIKLLLGLHWPSDGQVLIDGVPLRPANAADYRRMVAAVLQDDVLFAGTIADNIGFFDAAPDWPRLRHCAQLAAIEEDVLLMPMGYDTLVGDVGTGLSGGQKQRLLLARALYKQPKILVLDEATSHLDPACERRINAALRELSLTRVLVAHRAESVAVAQRVITLERGRIARETCGGQIQ